MHRSLPVVAVFVITGLSAAAPAAADAAHVRRGWQAADQGPARVRLLREAEKALTAGPFSVTQKTRVAPSGDKHDFLTLAPYWWPDSTKPGGIP